MIHKRKLGLIPNDFGDFLAILSFIGFIAIFFQFGLEKPFLSESLTPLFLIIGGLGLMVVGRVIEIGKWASDGIQSDELALVFSIVLGLISIFLGVLIWTGVELVANIKGWVGLIALLPALFIIIHYVQINK